MGFLKSAHILLTKTNTVLLVVFAYAIDASVRTAGFAFCAYCQSPGLIWLWW